MSTEPQLIDMFAAFAMLRMDWGHGEDDANAMDAYAIAESMMLARSFFVDVKGERNV